MTDTKNLLADLQSTTPTKPLDPLKVPTISSHAPDPNDPETKMLYTMIKIEQHLARIDRRDRTRMIGATIKGLFTIIPSIAFIAASWYVYTNGDQLMQSIAERAGKIAGEYVSQQTSGLTETMKGLIPKRK
jgi:hypothetical protein